MKHLRVFSIILGCMAAFMMTSCLKDDNSDEKEKEWEEWQKKVDTERRAMVGDYSGFMYYNFDITKQQRDSVAMSWSAASDTTIVFKNVPLQLVVNKMVGNDELKEAIAAQGTVDIMAMAYVNYQYYSPIQMYLFPDPIVIKDILVGGQKVKVSITFDTYDTSTGYPSYAKFMMSTGEMVASLYPKDVYVNNDRKAYFSPLAASMQWYGKRR